MPKRSLAVDRMTDVALIRRLRTELFYAESIYCPGKARTPGGHAIKRAMDLAREIEMRGTQLSLCPLRGGEPAPLTAKPRVHRSVHHCEESGNEAGSW